MPMKLIPSKWFVPIVSALIVLPTATALLAATERSGPRQTQSFEAKPSPPRPNILWITSEDTSPDMGCYGVEYANTPTLDRLASQGVLYTNAYAVAGVCAPSRSSLITGVYPSSLGSQHMRCRAELPKFMKLFPAYLREAGYYCTNNKKEDYNLPSPPATWDESSATAHYKNRAPGQPFFAVFNIAITHEHHMFGRHKLKHDPAKAPVPPYLPDVPAVRRDWARYFDQLTRMDKKVDQILDELERRGLADETIVFYFSDHGAALPRGKRWLWDSGLHVPLIIRFPEKYQYVAPAPPGSKVDRLVSLVDFAPTILSLCGVGIPDYMQGRAFLGPQEGEPRQYVYGIRGRMDERYDMQRAIRTKRYKYILNFMPHKTYNLRLHYMYRMETMQVWQRMHERGMLTPVQSRFFTPRRPVEELYDTKRDPYEVRNLANDPQYQDIRKRLRSQLLDWMRRTRDVGLLPEPQIRHRPEREGYENVYQWAHAGWNGGGEGDEGAMGKRSPRSLPVPHSWDAPGATDGSPAGAEQTPYHLNRILQAALTAGQGVEKIEAMIDNLSHTDPAVRFWGAVGLNALIPPHANVDLKELIPADSGSRTAHTAKQALFEALEDPFPAVAAEAAHALIKLGHTDKPLSVLAEQLKSDREYVRLRAAITLDKIDEKARPLLEEMKACIQRGGYPAWVLKYALPQIR